MGGSVMLLSVSKTSDNLSQLIIYGIAALLFLNVFYFHALRKAFVYMADQTLLIDRQTQQLASIEKRLEDTRQTAKQALAAVNSQKEKV